MDQKHAARVWAAVEKIREASPVIHNITNYVVMNTTANALLALGASPDKIIFANTIKSEEDIAAAKRRGVRLMTFDNEPELYKIVLLALGAGMRRDEIDTLQWKQILWDRNAIRVETTEFGATKSDESENDIDVDPGLLEACAADRRLVRSLGRFRSRSRSRRQARSGSASPRVPVPRRCR